MSVEFSNAYQEILLENLMAIIKQNFIFQTQMKLTEDVSNERNDLQQKYNELLETYNSIKDEVGKIESYKHKAEQNNSAHEEKSRIQAALNEQMKANASLKRELDEKNSILNEFEKRKNNDINELKDYIKKLEEIAPITKLKKINPQRVAEMKSETPKTEDINIEKVTDGSSF